MQQISFPVGAFCKFSSTSTYISFKFKALFLHININSVHHWHALQTQHLQVVQIQFHYLEFSVNLIEQICICQLFGKLPPTKIPSSKIIEGERLGDFLRKVVLHSVIFTECFFFYCTMAPMILKRKEKAVVGANRKCEIAG